MEPLSSSASIVLFLTEEDELEGVELVRVTTEGSVARRKGFFDCGLNILQQIDPQPAVNDVPLDDDEEDDKGGVASRNTSLSGIE